MTLLIAHFLFLPSFSLHVHLPSFASGTQGMWMWLLWGKGLTKIHKENLAEEAAALHRFPVANHHSIP